MQRKKAALNILRKQGMRITQIRKQLISFILDQRGHWHIQGMAENIQKKLPKMGIATIYRTVNLLVEEGFVVKTDLGGGSSRYEVTPSEHHDHLTCNLCGAIVEFENDQIEDLQKKVAKQLGFKLLDHRMELYGECLNPSSCKRKGRENLKI